MKHYQIRLVYLLSALVLFPACSGRFLNSGFAEFSDATVLLGKNIEYVFERSHEEELNLRMAESQTMDAVSVDDFLPKIVTMKHLETRKELIKYLTGYVELLSSLIAGGEREVFQRQAVQVYSNIRLVNLNHDAFLDDEEQGMIAAIAAAVPEAMTATKRRRMVLKIMEENQPRLEKIAGTLADEIQGLQVMLNNFYDRQFRLLVADRWGGDRGKRETYARLARELTVRREKINVIMNDLTAAMTYIPRTHKALRDTLRKNGSPGRVMAELLDFSQRIEDNFQDFSR